MLFHPATHTKAASALHQSGLDKLLEQLRKRPENLPTILAGLRDDPRGTIKHLFRLTAGQRAFLENLSDEALGRLVAPVVSSGAQGVLQSQRLVLERCGEQVSLRLVKAQAS
ncbi:MAG: hypothetical protein U1A78_09775 [Polyangia bacterium]